MSAASERQRTPYPDWLVVLVLTLMWGFVGLNRMGIGYIMPAILAEFHLEFWQSGLLVSGTSLMWACSAWLSGSLSDRIGRRSVLLVGMYAACAFAALFGATWNFVSAFVARDLIGLADGVGFAVGQSTIADRASPQRRALYQGIFSSGYAVLGVSVGAVMMTRLTSAFGWRWTFPIVAVIGALITTGLAVVLPRDRRDRHGALHQLNFNRLLADSRVIIGVPGVVPAICCTTLGVAWLGLNVAFDSLFLTQVRGYSLDQVGTILAVAALIALIGPLLLPALSDRVGRKPVAIIAAVGAGVAYLIFPVVPLPTPALIAVLSIGGMLAGGLAPLMLATSLSELVPEHMGAAIGIANLFSATLGGLLSPVYGGILADRYGLFAPLILAAVLQLLIAPFLVGVPETAPRKLARRSSAGNGFSS